VKGLREKLSMVSFEIDLGNLEASAKVDGHGQAKLLSDEELSELFEVGFPSLRDRALFAIRLFTGCRISEALQRTAERVTGNSLPLPATHARGRQALSRSKLCPHCAPFWRIGNDRARCLNPAISLNLV
jgi:integrase/recombinase XerD